MPLPGDTIKFTYKGLKIKHKNFCDTDFNNANSQYVCSSTNSNTPHD